MLVVSSYSSVEIFFICLPLLLIGILYCCLQCFCCNKGYSKEVRDNLG